MCARRAIALERLVDIDAYDYRNQERLQRLRGKADAGISTETCQPADSVWHDDFYFRNRTASGAAKRSRVGRTRSPKRVGGCRRWKI